MEFDAVEGLTEEDILNNYFDIIESRSPRLGITQCCDCVYGTARWCGYHTQSTPITYEDGLRFCQSIRGASMSGRKCYTTTCTRIATYHSECR